MRWTGISIRICGFNMEKGFETPLRKQGEPISRSSVKGLQTPSPYLFPDQLCCSDLAGELIELGDLRSGEVKSASGVGNLACVRFDLAGEHGVVVAVAEDIVEDGFEVLDL